MNPERRLLLSGLIGGAIVCSAGALLPQRSVHPAHPEEVAPIPASPEQLVATRIADAILFVDGIGGKNKFGRIDELIAVKEFLGSAFDASLFTTQSVAQVYKQGVTLERYQRLSQNQRQTAIVAAYIHHLREHQGFVKQAYTDTLPFLPLKQVTFLPLDDALIGGSYTERKIGVEARTTISAQEVGDMLSQEAEQRSNSGKPPRKIVNLSFQVGTGALILLDKEPKVVNGLNSIVLDGRMYYAPPGYDIQNHRGRLTILLPNGRPAPGVSVWTEEEYKQKKDTNNLTDDIIRDRESLVTYVLEAYSPLVGVEQQQANVMNLLNLASRFPDKLFTAAAGNTNSDISLIRAQLETQGLWPDNLLVIGFAENKDGNYHVFSTGADVYSSQHNSSSEATASVSALASMLDAIDLMITAQGLKAQILALCDPIEFTRHRILSESLANSIQRGGFAGFGDEVFENPIARSNLLSDAKVQHLQTKLKEMVQKGKFVPTIQS